MRIYKSKNKITFVASPTPTGGTAECPTLTLSDGKAKMRDDYHGSVRLSKHLTRFIF